MSTFHNTNMRLAFTQMELIFVIIILAILGTTAIEKMATTRDDAKLSTDVSNMGRCVDEAASKYVASEIDIGPGDSIACDTVKCYNITYATNGTNFTVTTNPNGASYCTQIDQIGSHLARTYVFKGARISY